MDAERLVKVYRSVHDSDLPLPLKKFILRGDLVNSPASHFADPANSQLFTIKFIKDMETRMDGTSDQAIRIAIAKKYDTQEPIGFAELLPHNGEDIFFYYLVVFPEYDTNRMVGLDENDPCPVFLLKYRGHPDDDAFDEDDLGEDVESDFECELHRVSESFDQFVGLLKNVQ